MIVGSKEAAGRVSKETAISHRPGGHPRGHRDSRGRRNHKCPSGRPGWRELSGDHTVAPVPTAPRRVCASQLIPKKEEALDGLFRGRDPRGLRTATVTGLLRGTVGVQAHVSHSS